MVWGPPGRWDLYSHTTPILLPYYSHKKSLFHMGRWMKVLSARGALLVPWTLDEDQDPSILLNCPWIYLLEDSSELGSNCRVRIKHQPTDCWSIIKHLLLCACAGVCTQYHGRFRTEYVSCICTYIIMYMHTYTYIYYIIIILYKQIITIIIICVCIILYIYHYLYTHPSCPFIGTPGSI